MVLQLIVACRIYYGLVESNEVVELRRRANNVSYLWEWQGEAENSFLDRLQIADTGKWLLSGLYGKSLANVASIDFGEFATDDDLLLISNGCFALKHLYVHGSEVSPHAICNLIACKKLEVLDLGETPTDDAVVCVIATLPRLMEIHLDDTLVSDKCLGMLYNMPNVHSIHLQFSDVSIDGVRELKTRLDGRGISIAYDELIEREYLLGSILWSDNARSVKLLGVMRNIHIEGPLIANDAEPMVGADLTPNAILAHALANYNDDRSVSDNVDHIRSQSTYFSRRVLRIPHAEVPLLASGLYRCTMAVGGYEAEPVPVIIDKQGVLFVRRIVFKMPVRKCDVLR